MSHSSSKTVAGFMAVLLAVTFASSFSSVQVYAQSSGHMTSDQSHLPTANIGDRQLALDFTTTPAAPLPGDQIDMDLSLIDKNTGKNAPHVSYTVIITKDDGTQVFSEVVHGHEGKVSIRFINDASAQTYRVSANYDNLAASYVSDFGSPIKVQGQVFSTASNYKVAIEVTGIDFDNTFLPEPLKYDFVLPLTPKQTLTVNYQDTAFDVGAYSSAIAISKAELKTENKQLILSSSSGSGNATGHSGDFTIRLEIPKQMMSGPFSAALGSGAALDVKEDASSSSDKITTLVLTGRHEDVVQADAPSGSSQSTIIVTAANVVPEFPVGLAGTIAAVGFAAIILYVRTLKAGKMQF
ncbi:hypothetical protein NTE_01042 [Candidatus Nitrososphaera evergladensis SR1]|jgi:hypothetical protein|uniref:Uncharacterized protein n=1 Tax=Candidatus Nitrososphaera evergladensis SR1 TaxID=1459636 RepID=A0A075MPR5_9ARCH|nr:hypothetical protein [Candidatus Nitrososphaera evergladensis]AIF83115.1 hypothetical protein NTE_01042 [Candidatus Nitrososphaera evergladensis SR1]